MWLKDGAAAAPPSCGSARANARTRANNQRIDMVTPPWSDEGLGRHREMDLPQHDATMTRAESLGVVLLRRYLEIPHAEALVARLGKRAEVQPNARSSHLIAPRRRGNRRRLARARAALHARGNPDVDLPGRARTGVLPRAGSSRASTGSRVRCH